MDPHVPFASRDELWHLQNDMKSVYSTQVDHADRLSRLERKLEEDNRVKSVWRTSSPFPSAVGGTPQHDPGYNPAAEAFKTFDQEQNNNLLGSLHLDADDEPRRGASRANSVRFDESALQGQGSHFGHTSRSSSEFFPVRTGSGMGGVSMLERSSSHKSDGRQSSTHSTRLNSLALDSRSPGLEGLSNMGPPPGLLLLGPHPAIIRCWLDSNFSNESLLYAAICTGSFTSTISSRIARRLNRERPARGDGKIALTIYFPEATMSQSSNRALDLIPRVPSVSAEFEVLEVADKEESIQVIIGSDMLRIKNADISFSQERITLFDDEHHKLAIPLVRPENLNAFRNLRTSSVAMSSQSSLSMSGRSPENEISAETLDRSEITQKSSTDMKPAFQASVPASSNPASLKLNTSLDDPSTDTPALSRPSADTQREASNGIRSSTPTREKDLAMWGNWRRDNGQTSTNETTFSSVASSANSQSGSKSRGMKVLRPSRSGQSRSTSSSQTLSAQDTTQSRWSDAQSNRGAPSVASESGGSQLASPRRSFSSEAQNVFGSSTNKVRPANPVGGGSAFGWLNSGQK